ncbi:MAG: 4Fe-4S binding protein [Deltaproteobacteria bacterium]|nr:4Fe-4S binding protein [Deltaproteobacteria bacterium]MBW2085643.1 4Fe-4S binding protein [Deltaproteobacteria bacterium]
MAETSLYQQLAEAIGVGDSQIIPEIFQMLANENEAKVILAAAPPATAEEIAEKAGLPTDDVEKMMEPLFKKGLIFMSKKAGPTRYYRVRQLFQFHDSTILTEGVSQEFYDLWKKYMDIEFRQHHKRFESSLPNSVVRVIPVNIVLEPDARIAAFEDVKQIVQDAENLAVTKCTCRTVDGKCGKPVEVCIQVNRSADYALQRGTGRKLTPEEAIEMLKMCEEEGLVHVIGNRQAIGNVICNCCSDCCINWPGPRTSPVNFTAPSRFTAVVDADLCTACETCLDRCHFEAITMEGEDDTALINADLCMGCGLCAVTCPSGAMTLEETRSEEFVPA